MEAWIEKFSKFPTANKILVWCILAVLVSAGNFVLFLMPLTDELANLESSEVTLNQDLVEKREYAQNLEKNKREMELKEQLWAEALTQLPDRKGMDELLKQFDDIGTKAGLEFSFKNLDEDTKDFIARMPVQMTVSGTYAEIGMFLQEVANMRRIVNVTNIKLTDPKPNGDKIVLRGDFLVTTFRFIENSEKKEVRK